MSLNPGDIIVQRYQIDCLLGRGGFSQTYLAKDINFPSKRFCVVKEIKPLSNEPVVLQEVGKRFQIEADILARLDQHDRIPKLFAYFKENGNFYLVQEYIEGNELSQEIRLGKQLSEDEVINLLTDILAWQIEKEAEILTIKGNSKWITSLAISPDGETLISGSSDGTIKQWLFKQGKELGKIKGQNEQISAIAISTDGQIFASLSSDGIVKLWDFQTGEKLKTFGDGLLRIRFSSVAFNSDGQILVKGRVDGTIHLWDLAQKRELAILKGHKDKVRTLAFNPDGETFASGSNRTIKIWQLGNREAIATLTDHLQKVYTLAFTPDGQMLVSGSMDKTIKIWGW